MLMIERRKGGPWEPGPHLRRDSPDICYGCHKQSTGGVVKIFQAANNTRQHTCESCLGLDGWGAKYTAELAAARAAR